MEFEVIYYDITVQHSNHYSQMIPNFPGSFKDIIIIWKS